MKQAEILAARKAAEQPPPPRVRKTIDQKKLAVVGTATIFFLGFPWFAIWG